MRDRGSIRKHRPCYRYGNYLTYYGYRVRRVRAMRDARAAYTCTDRMRAAGSSHSHTHMYIYVAEWCDAQVGAEMDDDPRLKLLKAEWFQNKRMVDIGCNAGLVTLRAAARFLCSSVVGVDIDKQLVQKAIRALCTARDEVAHWNHHGACHEPAVVRSASTARLSPVRSVGALRWVGTGGGWGDAADGRCGGGATQSGWSGLHVHSGWTPAAALQSLRRVTFTHANFVQDTHRCDDNSADTVMWCARAISSFIPSFLRRRPVPLCRAPV